jgi:hypothetical protein
MQVQGLVEFVVQDIGHLIKLMSGAMVTFGTDMEASGAMYSVQMERLTNGIFGTTDGLIYWMKNDLFYLVNNLGTATMAAKLVNFIAALIIGSGATSSGTFPWPAP